MTTVLAVHGLRRDAGVRAPGAGAGGGVDFALRAGEVVALVGGSGADRSALVDMLGGRLAPGAGRILLDGRDIAGLPAHRLARRGVARTFAVATLWPSMTVLEHVQLAIAVRERRAWRPLRQLERLARDEAFELLARCDLARFADLYAFRLGPADRQRVELALALAGRPRLLLLEEPGAWLSPGQRDVVMALVPAEASARGVAALFTADAEDSALHAFADRTIVLAC